MKLMSCLFLVIEGKNTEFGKNQKKKGMLVHASPSPFGLVHHMFPVYFVVPSSFTSCMLSTIFSDSPHYY